MRVAKRTRDEASFKAKVALEALKERKTASELGSQFGVHPNQVTEWRRQLVAEASSLFEAWLVEGRGRGKSVGVAIGGSEKDALVAFCTMNIWKRKIQQHALGAFSPWTKATPNKL